MLSLDTNYSRIGASRDCKELPSLRRFWEQLGTLLPVGDREREPSERVRPDLILHQRQKTGQAANAVVCEVKRDPQSLGDVAAIAYDIAKLLAFRDDLEYRLAFLILLGEDEADTHVHRVHDVNAGEHLVRELVRLFQR